MSGLENSGGVVLEHPRWLGGMEVDKQLVRGVYMVSEMGKGDWQGEDSSIVASITLNSSTVHSTTLGVGMGTLSTEPFNCKTWLDAGDTVASHWGVCGVERREGNSVSTAFTSAAFSAAATAAALPAGAAAAATAARYQLLMSVEVGESTGDGWTSFVGHTMSSPWRRCLRGTCSIQQDVRDEQYCVIALGVTLLVMGFPGAVECCNRITVWLKAGYSQTPNQRSMGEATVR